MFMIFALQVKPQKSFVCFRGYFPHQFSKIVINCQTYQNYLFRMLCRGLFIEPRRPQISFRVRARVARGSGIGQVPASGCERMCRGTVTFTSARTHLSAFDARSTCSRRLAVAVACRVFARTCVQGALSACR